MLTAAHPDATAFLRAICANPADDLPRLIYADFLDEHGQPERAEFIHVQCKLARLQFPGVSPTASLWKAHRDALRRREQALLDAAGLSWLPAAGIPAGCHSARTSPGVVSVIHERWQAAYTFRRGFPESITLPAAAWLEHGAAILATVPVTRVTFSDDGPMRNALTAPACLRGGVTVEEFRRLADQTARSVEDAALMREAVMRMPARMTRLDLARLDLTRARDTAGLAAQIEDELLPRIEDELWSIRERFAQLACPACGHRGLALGDMARANDLPGDTTQIHVAARCPACGWDAGLPEMNRPAPRP